jgi:hypothetical protein
MDKEQAIEFYNSKKWESMTDIEKVKFQLYESKLCMPFSIFQEAMESVLGRPIYTHEFADSQKLKQEFELKNSN